MLFDKFCYGSRSFRDIRINKYPYQVVKYYDALFRDIWALTRSEAASVQCTWTDVNHKIVYNPSNCFKEVRD